MQLDPEGLFLDFMGRCTSCLAFIREPIHFLLATNLSQAYQEGFLSFYCFFNLFSFHLKANPSVLSYSSVVEHLPNIHESLGFATRTAKKNK